MQRTVPTQSFVNAPHTDGEGGTGIFPREPLKRCSVQMAPKLLTRYM